MSLLTDHVIHYCMSISDQYIYELFHVSSYKGTSKGEFVSITGHLIQIYFGARLKDIKKITAI